MSRRPRPASKRPASISPTPRLPRRSAARSINRSLTRGALVTASQTTLLTTIRTIDPINVDVTASSTDLLNWRQAIKEGRLKFNGPDVHVKLKLDNGTTYSHTGKLAFVESNVSQTTGTFALRAEFPNPDRLLLPGMYVRALIEEGVAPNSYLVPQRAVTRNTKGEATAMFVAADGKVEQRVLSISRNVGNNWLVQSGIHDGDRVIVEGTLLVRPGQAVTPSRSPSTRTPARSAPANKAPCRLPKRRRSPTEGSKPAIGREIGDVAIFHRPPDLCLGHRHRHHAGRLVGATDSLSISQYPQIAPTTVQHQRDLPRRRRRDRRELGDQDHRTGHDRHRQSRLHDVDLDLDRPGTDHAHLHKCRQPRHRPGAGAEQAAARHAVAAADRPKQRPLGHEIIDRLSDGDRLRLDRRQAVTRPISPTMSPARSTTPSSASTASATPNCSAPATRCGSGWIPTSSPNTP